MIKHRQFRLKLIAGFAISLLLLWLALPSNWSGQRFEMLSELYRTGQLTHLSGDDKSEFQLITRAVALAAGISDKSLIADGSPQKAHLHFYVTDPGLEWFTRCGKGNAIYDSELDTIFIDRTLWEPTELPRIGQSWPLLQDSAHFAFSRTFLDFILLHELGHRQRHGSRGRWFDVSDKDRQEEIEADSFAVNALKAGYAKGLIGQDAETREELAGVGISAELPASQRAIAALSYAVAQMSVGLLFSRGAFSSLYSDKAHPSFGERMTYLEETLAAIPRDDASLRPYLEYVQQVLGRMELVRQKHPVEIHSPTPLEAIEFDEDGLTLVDTSWKVWHVESGQLRKQSSSFVEPQFIGAIPVRDPMTYVASMWSIVDKGVFIASFQGEIFQIQGRAIVPRHDLSEVFGYRHIPVVIPSGQPASISVHESGTNLILMNSDHIGGVFAENNVITKALGGNRHGDARVLESTGIGNMLHIPIYEQAGPIAGCLELKLGSSESARFRNLQQNADLDAYGNLVALQDSNIDRHFMIGKVGSAIAVWELFPDREPLLRASSPTFASQLSKQASTVLQLQVEPYIFKIRTIASNSILFSFVGDSIYEFDVHSNNLKIIFHPGTNVNIHVAADGHFALYAVNGYKAFVSL